MYQGLLGLHSLLRWLILLFLIINILSTLVGINQPFTDKNKSWNLRLLIVTHITILIGLYQYFFGPKGLVMLTDKINYPDTSLVMKDPVLRFWAVEHITGMLIAAVLITVSRSIAKNNKITDASKNKKLAWLYILSFIIIMASIPWPFRIDGTPWFRSFLS